MKYEKFKTILEAYDRSTNKAIEEIIAELKKDSKTYKEVGNQLMSLKRNFEWGYSNKSKYSYLFSEVSKSLDEEIGNIQLVNCSKTINQMRSDYGLEPIEDGGIGFIKKEIAPEVPVQDQSKEVQLKIDGKAVVSCLASYDKS